MWRLAAALVGVARKALDAISPGNVLNHRPYIVTYVHTHQHIFTHSYTPKHTHRCARAYTHERKPMLVCVRTQVHTKSHTHTPTRTHTHTRAPTTDTHKNSRARSHTHTHTHTHTRTHPPTNPHAVYAASFWQCRTASVRPPELLASRRSKIRPQGAKYWHCYR